MVNLDAFNRETADPEYCEEEIDWFGLFKKYQPIMMRALNTTLSELANVWGITESDIQYALKSERILVDDKGDWYINSNEWEPQSICYDCRHPKSETECTDPVSDYLKMLEAAL